MITEPVLPDIAHSPFLQKQLQLYWQMQADIAGLTEKGLLAEEAIQGAFEIAHHYKAMLAEQVAKHGFESITDEIIYFRHIRPLFNAEAEYHSYCYHIELFRKTVENDDPMELELFYRRQLRRMEKFSRDNREIYEYLLMDRADRDAEWFTRAKEDPVASLYDKQVGIYLAIRRFETYVQTELLKYPVGQKEVKDE